MGGGYMRAKSILTALALTLALVACGANGASQTPTGGAVSSSGGLEVGQPAPSFTAQLINGQQVNLESLRGKIVLVNFWATWCGPCRSEMPLFQTLSDKYDKKDFQVLAVNFLEKEDTIIDFTRKLNLKFDVALDPKGEINKQYGVLQYPVSYVIGRDGKILARQAGPFSPETLESALKKWIAS
jgi:cytochrome c biogenesis protein CcmG/thiol:disulfide interchange protein DsbE